jgi:hypothetical protein
MRDIADDVRRDRRQDETKREGISLVLRLANVKAAGVAVPECKFSVLLLQLLSLNWKYTDEQRVTLIRKEPNIP